MRPRVLPPDVLSGERTQDPLTHSQHGCWVGGIRTGWLREMMDREGSELILRREADAFGVSCLDAALFENSYKYLASCYTIVQSNIKVGFRYG